MTRPARQHRRRVERPDTLEALITRLGAQGDGIAEIDGAPVYVAGALPGERVAVRLGPPRGEGRSAVLDQILEAAPERVSPPCPHFGACGGCQVQHLSDDAYADWKRGLVVQAAIRAGLDPNEAEARVGPLRRIAPGTRRRVTFSAAKRAGRVVVGFHGRRSRALVPIDRCLLVTDRLNGLLISMPDLLSKVLADRANAVLTATETESGLDLVIAAGTAPDLAAREALATFAEVEGLARLSWQVGRAVPEPVVQREAPVVRFDGLAISPPPGAFLQPSRGGEAALIEAVRGAVGEAQRIADLYAGSGTLALPLSETATVHAVESDPDALDALSAAARREQRRVTVERRDLDRRPLRADELTSFRAVVFDPPRAGAKAQSGILAESSVPIVVGVSCNPATWARDARSLITGGYRLESVSPVDQFPWSHHVELVSVFRRHSALAVPNE